MRAFKIWTQQKFSFRYDGELFEGEVFGGSNDSLADARSDAARRWEAVCQRITGALPRRSADYEADSDPRSREMRGLMKALKVDRLYALLSQRQGCYRARLTAKPSRIGLKSLGQKWPVADDAVAARADWVAQYTTACRRFAACRFYSAVGDAPLSPVIALHDELSGALGTLPLA